MFQGGSCRGSGLNSQRRRRARELGDRRAAPSRSVRPRTETRPMVPRLPRRIGKTRLTRPAATQSKPAGPRAGRDRGARSARHQRAPAPLQPAAKANQGGERGRRSALAARRPSSERAGRPRRHERLCNTALPPCWGCDAPLPPSAQTPPVSGFLMEYAQRGRAAAVYSMGAPGRHLPNRTAVCE